MISWVQILLSNLYLAKDLLPIQSMYAQLYIIRGSGFRVQCRSRFQGSGQGVGFRAGYRIQGLRYGLMLVTQTCAHRGPCPAQDHENRTSTSSLLRSHLDWLIPVVLELVGAL